MLSDRLRRLAAGYVIAQKAQGQDDTSDELKACMSEACDQFMLQLDVDGIRYFDREDAARIAAGIVDGTFDVLYHGCGRAIVLDGDIFRIHDGDLAGHVIERCPGCGMWLDAFDLYADPGGRTRNLLRQAGLYPTADGLVLMADPERRTIILRDLREALGNLGNGDLLAVYAVVVAMIGNDE